MSVEVAHQTFNETPLRNAQPGHTSYQNANYDGFGMRPFNTKIAAKFSVEKYRMREALLLSKGQSTDLPPGFPKSIDGPAVWQPDTALDDMIHELSSEDINEIMEAVTNFACMMVNLLYTMAEAKTR
jgi:hypothetical protein